MSQEKVKNLYVQILEECEQQGFTIAEFRLLIKNLEYSENTRNRELPNELPFIPGGKTAADYTRL